MEMFSDQKIKAGLQEIAGHKVIISHLACNPEYETIPRTWRERLFTRPWQPRRKYKQILKELNPYIIKKEGLLVVHPSLLETLKEQSRSMGTKEETIK